MNLLSSLISIVFILFSIGQAMYQPKPVQPVRQVLNINKAQAISPENALHVPILMYHHIGGLPPGADAVRRDLTVSLSDFNRQLDWLQAQGYHSVTLAQLYSATQKQYNLPSHPVVFTFDDGYEDASVNAMPILRQHGFIGSFGIITQFVGQPDYMTWDDIRLAAVQGMEMVSHTQTHFDGSDPAFSSEFIKSNLIGSRGDLLKNAGVDTQILIYPYGHFSSVYVAAEREAGFVMGLTVQFGQDVDPASLFTVPRVRVHAGESLDVFEKILAE